MNDEAGRDVDGYLDRVRKALRGMPKSEIDEIVLELRGHIADRSEATGDAEGAMRALGDPQDIARDYLKDRVAARAECSGSPIVILHSLALLSRGKFAGWAVLALTALAYAWAFVLGGASIEKIISPHDVGIWYRPGTFSLPRLRVDGPGPAGSRELLGWWIVPAGLAACAVLVQVAKSLGRWWIRRSRAERVERLSST